LKLPSKIPSKIIACLFGLLFAVTLTTHGWAEERSPFFESYMALLERHKLVKAAESDITGARERIRSATGGWYPRLTLSAFYGKEKKSNHEADNTLLLAREFDISVTQLLWDFGVTNSLIRTSQLQLEQKQSLLIAARQGVLLRALSAHVNVRRSYEVLQFSKQSEENIKAQAELEDALVERGAGLSTDVLQAKVTLAGAEARRVQSEGAFKVSLNSYKTIFYEFPQSATELELIALPDFLLPEGVDEAVQLAFEGNPNLRASMIDARIAAETIQTTKATEFYPTLEFIGEMKFKKEVGGAVGSNKETLGKVQFTYPFNLGFTAVNSLRAAEADSTAASRRVSDLKDQIEEQARNAWSNLQTAKESAALLGNQANISAEFLELARKERQLGKRSLIDVLAGETSLINSQSDAASAESDVIIASITLLSIMGQLGVEVISVVDAGPASLISATPSKQ
jgi:adhesin transport system outer membrane protein